MGADNFSARYVGRLAFSGGAYKITAIADDGVRVYLDGVRIIDKWFNQAATTYSVTKTVDAGLHEVKVEYFEHRGAAEVKLAITAATPLPDTKAPTVSLTGPVAGAALSGRVTVAATAADDVGVVGVQFKLDGANLAAEDMTAPYAVVWDTSSATTGSHVLSAIARDAAGNTGRAADVQVTVTREAPPPTEPGPIAGQGYHQVFRDDFDGTALAPVWHGHAYWLTSIPGAVTVSNGTVKIASRRSDGRPENVSISSGPEWSGPQPRTWQDWQFGYFEARMRTTDAKGAWGAFWLSSTAHATANWPTCPEPDLNYELDIFEQQGDEPFTFYGTQHRNTNGVCGVVPDQTRSTINPNMPQRLQGAWHKFAAKWTATDVTYYVDDQPIGTDPLFDSGDQPMYILLTEQACGWDPTNACDASTPNDLVTEVDHVTVWQQ